MLVPHTCLNAAVGTLFKKPLAAAIAGIASHALLDLLPHKDISAHKAEGATVLLLLGIVGSSCGWSSPAFWCAMGGVLPDVEQVLPWTDPKRGRRRYFPTHSPGLHSLQIRQAPNYRASLLEQTVVSTVSLAVTLIQCRPKSAAEQQED
jgi:hypothetical protein